jgi:hypothetical protein
MDRQNNSKRPCQFTLEEYFLIYKNVSKEKQKELIENMPDYIYYCLLIENLEQKCINCKENLKDEKVLKYFNEDEIKEVFMKNFTKTEKDLKKLIEDINADENRLKRFKLDVLNEKNKRPGNTKKSKPFKAVEEYKLFQITSKETNFQKYNTEIEINGVNAQTKPCKLDNDNKNKGITISKGSILCCLFSPLDWLNKEYKLTNKMEIEKDVIINKIKATKHFELNIEEINIYDAVCALIKKKKYDSTIFISFNELHRQLGYLGKLRQLHKQKYTNILYKFSYLYINIDFSEARNRKYKKFYEAEGNIKEPLVILHGFKKADVKYNNRVTRLEGFTVYPTNLMNLHFNHEYQTNKFCIEELPKNNNRKIKENHKIKLINYVTKLYFLQKENSKQKFTRISLDKIFEELKEFNIKEQYDRAKESKNLSRFMNRNIYNIIDSLPCVKNVTCKKNNNTDYPYNIIITWND